MVPRYLIHCRGCRRRLVLRIQISAGLSPDDPRTAQPFVFATHQTNRRPLRRESLGAANSVLPRDADVLGVSYLTTLSRGPVCAARSRPRYRRFAALFLHRSEQYI